MDLKATYLSIVKKHYPNISSDNIKEFLGGNDHFVFVVNNEIDFRFPRVPRKIDAKRSVFLKAFAPSSPITIPLINIEKDEETGIEYEMNNFIPGVSFYPEVAKTFEKNELMEVAKKLGEFLTAVHSFSIEKAREGEMDEMNPSDFWDYMQNNPTAFPSVKKIVYPKVSKKEQEWIEKVFTDYITLIKEKPFVTRVTHSDIWMYHIIVDPQKHTLTGVIDFWGRIADPANDFKAFEYYGSDFVEEVYKSYDLPVDENFEKRRLFYTGHDEVFGLVRAIEKKDKGKIEKHKKYLSDYIDGHPIV